MLPLLFAATRIYGAVYYVLCSPGVARRFANAIVASSARQLSEKDYLDGTYSEGRRRAVAAGRRLGATYPWLGRMLVRYGRSEAYLRFADSLFCRAAETEAFLSPFLERLFADLADRFEGIDFLVTRPPRVFQWSAPLSPSIRILNVYRPFAATGEWFIRAAGVAILLAFPFLNAVHFWRKGVRPGHGDPAPALPFLLIHRESALTDERRHFYRDLYFLRGGCLDARDCQHFPMATATPFVPAKVAFLRERSGHVVASSDMRPVWRQYGRRVFFDFFAAIPRALPALLFCPIVNWQLLRDLFEILHYQALVPFLLDHARAPAVILETEVSPFAQVVAIEARRLGRRSVSMIHGAGAQHAVGPTRFELQIEDMITYGSWDQPLRETNPAIVRCVPCGNIEIDRLDRSGAWLPPAVRERRPHLRLVAFLARLNHVLTTEASTVSGSRYLDGTQQKSLSIAYLGPFFRWIVERQDIVLVWKTGLEGYADGATRRADGSWVVHWRDWLAPLMAAIPPERFIYIPERRLDEVVAVCDLSICNDISSAFACAISAEGVALSFDLVFGGIFRRYHPRLSAVTGEELAENAEWLLANPIPEEARRRFNEDFYGMPVPDFRAGDRIKSYFRALARTS